MPAAQLTETLPELSTSSSVVWADIAATVSTAIAVVVGTMLRWMQLGTRSLWFDEGYTAWAVSQPMREIIRVIRADTAPPLYYLILHQWTAVFGRSEAGMRSLSATFATLTLLVFVALARRILKNPWALTAAVWLFSLSFMQIAYSHEARFYAMMAFLGAVDLYLVLLLCERSSAFRLAITALAWSASLYTNNVMAVYLAALGGAWLFAPGDRPLRKRVIDLVVVTVVSALAFSPWLPALRAQMAAVHGHFWAEIPDISALKRTFAVMVGVHERSLGPVGIDGMMFIDLGILGSILAALRVRRQAAIVMVLITFSIAPIVFIYLYSHVAQSIYMDRAFLVSSVGLPLLVTLPLAAPLRRGGQRAVVVAGLAALICLSIRSLPVEWLGTQEENWREAMRFAVQRPARHRLVVFVANEGETLYDYYVRGSDYSPRTDLVGVPSSFFAIDPPHTMRHVESDKDLNNLRQILASGQFDQVVFVASHHWFADPPLRTFNLLQSKLPLIDQKTITRLTVFRFGAATARPS